MKSNGIWWDSWPFKTQILTNPLEYDGIHGVMTLKSFQIKWNLMGFMGLWHSNLFKSNGIWWDSWGYDTQIFSNPMESDWIHEVLRLKSYQIQWNLIGFMRVLQSKSYQIQWNLKGFMRFYNPNLIKSNGTWWDLCLMGFMRFLDSNLIKPIRFDT